MLLAGNHAGGGNAESTYLIAARLWTDGGDGSGDTDLGGGMGDSDSGSGGDAADGELQSASSGLYGGGCAAVRGGPFVMASLVLGLWQRRRKQVVR